MNIFVTYGTQPHDFKYLTEIVNQIDSKYQVTVQYGQSHNAITRPNTVSRDYYPDYQAKFDAADIIITHSGVGSIMNGLEREKKVIAISRLAEHGEHIDDHQLEVASKLAAGNYILHYNREVDVNTQIEQCINRGFAKYESNTTKFVSDLKDLLRGL